MNFEPGCDIFYIGGYLFFGSNACTFTCCWFTFGLLKQLCIYLLLYIFTIILVLVRVIVVLVSSVK